MILSSFNTTSEWQELTGVSSVASQFSIQNTGSQPFFIYLGDTPNEEDAIVITPIGKQGLPSGANLDGTQNTDKVWVKSKSPTKISINRM